MIHWRHRDRRKPALVPSGLAWTLMGCILFWTLLFGLVGMYMR